MVIKSVNSIVISRTDSIGDVALTLPMTGILKAKYPVAKLIFLGDTYTAPIIECCPHVDEVWIWSDIKAMPDRERVQWLKNQNIDVFIHVFPRREIARLAQHADIPHKIGTSHRLFHLLTCNHRVNFTRKKSDLHEAQLNIKLLKPLDINTIPDLKVLTNHTGFSPSEVLEDRFKNLLDPNKFNLILHCKSKGSALEWGVDNFITLANSLDPEQYTIFFTGTEAESEFFRHLLPQQDHIHDLSGQMTLPQLIAFIYQSNGLIAASTGPLHIAGLSNINTIGLFTPRRPLHPGRWQPLGNNVSIIEEEEISERHQPLQIECRIVKKVLENLNL